MTSLVCLLSLSATDPEILHAESYNLVTAKIPSTNFSAVWRVRLQITIFPTECIRASPASACWVGPFLLVHGDTVAKAQASLSLPFLHNWLFDWVPAQNPSKMD